MGYPHGPIEQRFMAKVNQNGPNGCWVWTGSCSGAYGQFGINHVPYGAHRVSMMLFKGLEIKPGRAMNIDHLCRNTLCVNPDHLEYVTFTENMRRARLTHCRRGHEFTEANTRWYRNHRYCRQCHAIHERRRWEKGITTNQRRKQNGPVV
jgi:hypothetical protein